MLIALVLKTLIQNIHNILPYLIYLINLILFTLPYIFNTMLCIFYCNLSSRFMLFLFTYVYTIFRERRCISIEED